MIRVITDNVDELHLAQHWFEMGSLVCEKEFKEQYTDGFNVDVDFDIHTDRPHSFYSDNNTPPRPILAGIYYEDDNTTVLAKPYENTDINLLERVVNTDIDKEE